MLQVILHLDRYIIYSWSVNVYCCAVHVESNFVLQHECRITTTSYLKSFWNYRAKDPGWTHLEMETNTLAFTLVPVQQHWCRYLSVCWRCGPQWQAGFAGFICNLLKLFPAWRASRSRVKASADCTRRCLASAGTFSLLNWHVEAVCEMIQPLIVVLLLVQILMEFNECFSAAGTNLEMGRKMSSMWDLAAPGGESINCKFWKAFQEIVLTSGPKGATKEWESPNVSVIF